MPQTYPPKRADRFRQRSHLDVDAAVHLEMINRAAAIASQHAGGVGVIHHHDGAIFLRQVAERGQRADIAVHGEDAVRDQQLFPGLVLYAGKPLLSLRDVLVLEDQNLCSRQARTVNDLGMI